MDKQLKNFAVGVLRSASIRWKAKSEARKLARTERGRYKCAMCEGIFKANEVHADHTDPVVPLTGWTNFDDFIERLFVTVDKYQILCVTCHAAKTMQEDEMRKYYTKERNEQKKIEEKEAKKLAKQKKKEEKNGST